MLNKELCKRCNIKHCGGWNWDSDSEWERGYVNCWHDIDNFYTSVKSDPPEECEYYLEHIVNAE